jgi:hypothetical protein
MTVMGFDGDILPGGGSLLWRIFPYRDRWVSEVRDRAANTAAVASSSAQRRTIGLAIEYAIGLDAAEGAYASRLAVSPPAHGQWIVSVRAGTRSKR